MLNLPDREVVLRAIRVSIVVGTVLALINHGDVLLSGDMNGTALFKIILTYFVPFGVALYSGARARR
jgi:hypothetical protein